MKKVLFVITKGNWGGAQKYVFDLATSLPKNAFEVSVACGMGEILPHKLTEAGIRVFTIPRLGRDVSITDDSLVFFDLIKLFRSVRPDVVHVNSAKIGGLGAFAARLAGIKKIIFTAHGWTWNENRPWIQKKVIVVLSWLTILFSHRVIVLGDKEKEQADQLPLCRGKIMTIPNGLKPVDFLSQDAARQELTAQAKKIFPGKTIPEGSLWIGTVSELHHNKGLDTALLAIAALPKADRPLFFIIGEGEERNRLEEMIQTLELEKQVFLLGYMKDAPLYIKALDIFTLTSKKEGLPYAVLEAGQAGLPVIASNVGNIPDIIKSGTSGILVEAGNVHETASALQLLLGDQAKCRELGSHLQSEINQKFNFQKMLEATENLYAN